MPVVIAQSPTTAPYTLDFTCQALQSGTCYCQSHKDKGVGANHYVFVSCEFLPILFDRKIDLRMSVNLEEKKKGFISFFTNSSLKQNLQLSVLLISGPAL